MASSTAECRTGTWKSRVHRAVGAPRVICVDGEVDAANAKLLGALLLATIRETPPQVLLDASALRFIDSSGIRELLRAQACAAMTGVAFGIVSPQPAVRRVFELTDVADLIVGTH